jgi:hypothetical protein
LHTQKQKHTSSSPTMKNDAVGPSIHNININSHPKEYMMDGG